VPFERQAGSAALIALAAALVAVAAGAAVAAGGTVSFATFALAAGLAIVAPILVLGEDTRPGFLSVELPVALLLLSTLVFRQRDVAQLADNPLDAAALFRVACVGAAIALALPMVLRTPSAHALRAPTAVRLYVMYVVVVFVGALFSVNPGLTTYRGIELLAGVVVIVGAMRTAGVDALVRLEQLLYGFVLLLVASVWVGVLAFPAEAVIRDLEPIPFQIQGVYPAISSNGVGELGAILLLWSLGRRLYAGSASRLDGWMVALGAVTLVAAQYRTGYVAVAAAIALLLVARWRGALAVLAVACTVVVGGWGFSTLVDEGAPAVLRGQTPERAAELSGRLYFWDQAIPVWLESPLFGKGLGTATRFEVLEPLGFSSTSTIHGTWIEALVGAGVAGTALLAAFLVLLWRRALPSLAREGAFVAPVLLLTLITVRTATGPTFELFGFTALLMLVLAYRLSPQYATGAPVELGPRRRVE
jgi:O-antigen ligase